jgi:preprotein translocase subunit SecA
MDYMRQSIHLRGYAQKDPKQEYKREAFNLFSSMLHSIRREVIRVLAIIQVDAAVNVEKMGEKMRAPQQLEFHHAQAVSLTTEKNVEGSAVMMPQSENETAHIPYVRSAPKVGRNEPCPCGSGRKYKHCHGKVS